MKRWISLLLALMFVLSLGTVAVADGEDAVGTVAGNVYNNGALGISMTLPGSWRFLSDSELAAQMGYDSRYASRDGLASLLSESSSACAMFATSTDDAAWTANLMVQDLGMFRSLDEQTFFDMAQDGLTEALEARGFSNIKLTKTTFKLAGKDHVGALMTGSYGFIQSCFIIVLVKGDQYMGSLTVTALTEAKARETLGYFAPASQTTKSASTSTKSDSVHSQISSAIAREDWATALKLLDGTGGKTYPDYANVRQNCLNHVNYEKAMAAMDNKLYYTAYTLFSAMGNFQDAASWAAKCQRPMPETGQLSRNSDFKRQTVRQNLTNELKGGYNIYVRIYDSTGTVFVASAFIRPGKTAVIYLPDSTYVFKAAYGKGAWYGENEMFGDDAIYKRLFTTTLEQVGKRGYYYFTFEDELAYTTVKRTDF